MDASELNATISIPAAPEVVWDWFMQTHRWAGLFGGVLVDPDPERAWSAPMRRTLRIKPFRRAPASSVEVDVRICEPYRLEWTSSGLGLAATRTFTVEATPDGASFRNCERVTGLVPRLAPGFFTRALTRTHAGFCEALRDSLLEQLR